MIAVIFGLASGCAFVGGSATGSAFVAGDRQHLRLPGADKSRYRAVAYRSPYGYEEYVRSRVDGRAEALLLQSRGTGIALQVADRRLESLTARWVYNRENVPLAWTQAMRQRLVGSRVVYRRYIHRRAAGDEPRECVAFIHTWKSSALDPLMRPSRAWFGYWCRPPGQSLSAADAKRYLRQIETAATALPGFHIGQSVAHQPAASALANGSSDPGWGIGAFPLQRFRRYPLGGSYSAGH